MESLDLSVATSHLKWWKAEHLTALTWTAISEEAQIKGTERRLAALICTCGYTRNETWKSVLLLHNNLSLHPPTQRCFYVRSWTALCRNTCISSGEACWLCSGTAGSEREPRQQMVWAAAQHVETVWKARKRQRKQPEQITPRTCLPFYFERRIFLNV